MGKAQYMKLQAVYSVTELAAALAISYGRTRRILKHASIPVRPFGNQRLVLISDIENQMPALWASVLACERARAITRALEGGGGPRRGTHA